MNGRGIGGREGWVLTAAPEEDELAWSHLQRIAVLNNLTSIFPLLREWACLRDRAARKISHAAAIRALHYLSSAAGESYEAYCRNHGMGCMVGLNGQIEAEYHYLRGGKLRSLPRGRAYVLPPSHQAKFCHSCQRADLVRRGFTWFRRIHQVIGLELCPAHEDLLMQCRSDYGSLSDTCDAAEAISGKPTNLSPKFIASTTPEIHVYAELMAWRCHNDYDARIYAMRDLAAESFSHCYHASPKPSVYEAIMGVFGQDHGREWFDYHFVAYFGDMKIINTLCAFPLGRIPPPLLAVALASIGDSSKALICQLEEKLEYRSR